MRMYDTFEVIFHDQQLAALFSDTSQEIGDHPPVCIRLSYRQAADAVRSRSAWKYLLCLELTNPSFDRTVLCG
jgi:transposase